MNGAWFIGDHTSTSLRPLIEYLDSAARDIRRRAARAKISLQIPEGQIKTVTEEEWIPVFDDIEPWSKNWLEWWEEENKLDLDGGEEADNTASAPDGQHLT